MGRQSFIGTVEWKERCGSRRSTAAAVSLFVSRGGAYGQSQFEEGWRWCWRQKRWGGQTLSVHPPLFFESHESELSTARIPKKSHATLSLHSLQVPDHDDDTVSLLRFSESRV